MKPNRTCCAVPLTLAAFALSLGGCASITGTTNQNVSVQTRAQGGAEVKGANCELTNNKGKWFVTTPGSVGIHRSNDDMQVLCTKDGIDPGRGSVVSETKGTMFGNIVFGGGIGAVVDHNTGAAYEYPALIQIIMGAFSKVETPKTTDSNAPISPSPQPTAAVPATLVAAAPRSQEEQLRDLKRLRDDGLIGPDVYLERQRQILDATR